MPHSKSSFNQDTGFIDGFFVVGAPAFNVLSGSATLTRGGKGLLYQAVGASATLVFDALLDKALFRTGTNFITQEQFGTAAGVAGISGVSGTSDADAQPAGYPGSPQSSVWGNDTAAQLTPRAAFIAKGVNINDITLVYAISGAALSTHTIGLSKTVYANDTAPAVTDVLTNAAHGLATATQAQPYVTKVSVNSGYLVTDLSEYIIELDVTTASGGAYDLYGAVVHVTFNFN